jgi:autophagy-related protein 18
MKLLYTIELNYNPHVVTAMSPSSELCYLAYPVYIHPPNTAPAARVSDASSGGITGGSTGSAELGFSNLASSGSSTVGAPNAGDITLFDAISLHPVTIISAHKAPLAAIAFSASGKLLATASAKGTIIRVFSVPDGSKLYQFRRGSYPARIFSLSFHPNDSLLAVSSETETVHVFRLLSQNPSNLSHSTTLPTSSSRLSESERLKSSNAAMKDADAASFSSSSSPTSAGFHTTNAQPQADGASSSSTLLLQSLVGSAAGAVSTLWNKRGSLQAYLPEGFVNGVLDSSRDFAFAKIPTGVGERSVVGFSGMTSHLLVVTAEGYFHQFTIDMDKGEECVLVKQYRLLDDP